MSRSLKAHILLVLVTFAWGATFVSVKDALVVVSPLVFNALRMATASAALVVIFWRELGQLFTRRDRQRADAGGRDVLQTAGETPALHGRSVAVGGALLGVFLWAGYSFQTVGLRLTTPSKSAFITGLAVVLVPLIVAISGRRVPNRWTMVGVTAAFAGLYLMTIPGIPTQAKNGLEWGTPWALGSLIKGINVGDLITLGCPISFALHIYTMGRLMRRYPFKPIAVIQILTATVLMAATIPLERPRLALTGEAVFAILFTGLICTAAAFSIQAWAQQFTPPTHTALIFVLEPVFAALTSYVLLGEHLGARGTIGAMLILGGILVSELKGSSVEPFHPPRAEFSIN